MFYVRKFVLLSTIDSQFMKNANTYYLVALLISTIAIFAVPQLTFGQHCFYILNLQDSDNCRAELISEAGQMYTSTTQWTVRGDNTGSALAYIEPTPDLFGLNDYTVVILEFFFNRTGFLLEDDFVKVQLYNPLTFEWDDALHIHANDLNNQPNKTHHLCAIRPAMYSHISDFRLRILVNSSANSSSVFIRSGEIWMSEVTLPLELTSFTVSSVDSRNTLLKWTTQNEENINRFEIERSENATDWTSVGKVGYTATAQGKYIFEDRTNGANVYYYRLKIIDNDGQYIHSGVVSLRTKGTPPRVFPTVANEMLKVEIDITENADLYIYNELGSLVQQKLNVSGIAQVNVSDFPAGNYFLQSVFGERRFSQSFIVNR